MRPPEPPPSPPLRARVARSACTASALVAAAFALTVGFLMVTDLLRYRAADPTDLPALELLREELREHPEQLELRDELRQLDALARSAHVSSLAFRQRGALLLLGGVAVILLALRGRQALTPVGPSAREAGSSRLGSSRRSARRTVALGALLVGGVALVLGWAFRPGLPPLPPLLDIRWSRPAWEDRLHNWPSFRGPDGLGRATDVSPPIDWDGGSGRNVMWKVPVPRSGFGSPVVWGDRVFVTGADDEARELYGFDAGSGELLWRHDASIPGGAPVPLPRVTRDTGHAAATPATDGERVFAVFSSGDLVAVDFEGRRLWSRQLGAPDNPYGHSASLLVWRHLLIVQFDHRQRAQVVALDTSTGATVWETERDLEVSWSSPILVSQGEQPQLVLNGNPWVIAYEPATGFELWRAKAMRGELAPSPAYGAGLVFVANRYARLAAIAPGERAVITWEHSRDLPEVSSPVASDSLLVMAHGHGTVSCLDPIGGEQLWQERFDEGFYASPVLADGRIYLMDRSGVMRIFAASTDYQLIASPALGEPSSATAAFVDDRIYLRGESHLFCIGAEGS